MQLENDLSYLQIQVGFAHCFSKTNEIYKEEGG